MKKLAVALSVLVVISFACRASQAAASITLSPERAGHAATRLNSGLVLVTGGVNENATLDSALLYNPATGTFTPTGNMTTARSNHTSTLLNDGKVLITGGDLATGQLSKTAELYDPTTGHFTLAAHLMTIGRDKHTANLLADGKVLLVGGKNADIYDPATQTFTATINAPSKRSSHAAVKLNDGTVLVSGGYVGKLASRDAWIYDPISQTFTQLLSVMRIPRSNHQTTLLLDGKVLVTGGYSGTSPHDEVDIYDPQVQAFVGAGKMKNHRSNHRALLLPSGEY